MSRLNLDSQTQAALLAAHLTWFVTLEFYFDTATVYLADTPFDVDIGGNTYTGAQGIGRIEPVTETDTEAKGLVFELSGVPVAAIASTLTEPVQGRKVVMKMVIVDAGTLRIDPCLWEGRMDLMTVDDGMPSATIRVTAEHSLIAWNQARGTLSSDADQKLRSATDRFYEYAPRMTDVTIVWPQAAFFRT